MWEFIFSAGDGEYFITRDLQLHIVPLGGDKFFDEEDVIDSFVIGDAYHTTSRLRDYCNKFHPEVNFDAEFETDKPGVFARYQEKFGFDYDEWINEQIYTELVSELNQMGYYLPFDQPER